MLKCSKSSAEPKSVRKNISLPSIGRITIGTGTVSVDNPETAISSEEMIKSLKKAAKKNLFPLNTT